VTTRPELPATLSIQTLHAGHILHRAHNATLGAVFFGPGAGNPPLYRFDSPDGLYGVCYLGVTEEAAFVEGVLHCAVPRRIISEKTLANRAISAVHLREDIRAVRLYGPYLVGNGATAAVVTATTTAASPNPGAARSTIIPPGRTASSTRPGTTIR
jgi:hypothetical protein